MVAVRQAIVRVRYTTNSDVLACPVSLPAMPWETCQAQWDDRSETYPAFSLVRVPPRPAPVGPDLFVAELRRALQEDAA